MFIKNFTLRRLHGECKFSLFFASFFSSGSGFDIVGSNGSEGIII